MRILETSEALKAMLRSRPGFPLLSFRWAGLLGALLVAVLSLPAASGQIVGEKQFKVIDIIWAESYRTKHYEIRYEQVIGKKTVKRIGRELEDILAEYVKLFRFRPGELLVVKFLESSNTYEQEGGDPSHPGYYNPGTKYLVLRQLPFRDLIPTVYHEAFHQYLQEYVGQRTFIPTWYNEGMAMYFERMQRNPGGKKALNPKKIKHRNLRMVKDAVFTRSAIPLEKLVDAGYKEFHDKETEQLHYNQSFAVIYFFMKVMGGKKPLAYARTLRKTQNIEKANAKLFGAERKKLTKIERAWKKYMAKVAIPKA
jgi:hypothetical protein